jgi:hypothetical protein
MGSLDDQVIRASNRRKPRSCLTNYSSAQERDLLFSLRASVFLAAIVFNPLKLEMSNWDIRQRNNFRENSIYSSDGRTNQADLPLRPRCTTSENTTSIAARVW